MTEKFTYFYRVHYNASRIIQFKREVDTDMNAILYIIDWLAKFNTKYSNIYRVQVYFNTLSKQNKIMDMMID